RGFGGTAIPARLAWSRAVGWQFGWQDDMPGPDKRKAQGESRRMAQRFKVGDVVQLKSGGPKMTVTDVDEGKPYVGCTWFAKALKEQATFPVDALERVVDTNTQVPTEGA